MSRPALAETEAAELLRLRREVRELREEVGEWRRMGPDLTEACEEESDLERVRGWLGGSTREARYLDLFLRNPGTVLTKALLFAASGTDEEVHVKIVDVYVCKVRNRLDRRGLRSAIATVWGQGYFVSKANAAVIQAAIRAFEPLAPSRAAVAPLDILKLLEGGAHTPVALATRLGVLPSVVNDELKALRFQGLVDRGNGLWQTALRRKVAP